MKFTSFTTMIISAAAMAGAAIASGDLVIIPMNLPCSPPSGYLATYVQTLDRLLTAPIRRYSGVLNRHQRLEQRRRFRVFLRI
ncbi:hypothetical protein DEU56DRAFT_837453, partial [Suillus clintonianus]|uniref:uncharacterized protein n=1 Tax=Suillus clintonianus TaxID=1904413 RepID=UPI001B8608B7